MRSFYTMLPGVGWMLLALSLTAQKNAQRPPDIGAAFLLINPDARSSATGDAVTGLAADVNSLYSNAAKIVFAGDWGISASYSPWMWEMNNSDQRSNMGYLSAFRNFNGREAAGLSVRYLSHGQVTFRDDNGTELQRYRPREFALDGSYARRLGEHFSLALTLRYIRSELGRGTYNALQQQAASAAAGDVGIYYEGYARQDPDGNRYSWGISFTNIGSKLKYTDDAGRKAFLPMQLRIGGGYTFVNSGGHQFTLAADIGKLLVPTPPVYKTDINGQPTGDIESGKDPDRGVPSAIITSFYDAPGGLREEIREFTAAAGLEYAYLDQFFVRTGYFYEHPLKGHRQHFSAGLGACFHDVRLDLAYVMPTDNSLYQRRTLKLSLVFTRKADRP